jgi:hypothetical protein
MKVSFTKEQFRLVRDLLHKHYDHITTDWEETDYKETRVAYGAVIAMRTPVAQKAWEEYCKKYPDPEWRAYPTREGFFEDQYTIYPEDLGIKFVIPSKVTA